jgi:hypothetical protein
MEMVIVGLAIVVLFGLMLAMVTRPAAASDLRSPD